MLYEESMNKQKGLLIIFIQNALRSGPLVLVGTDYNGVLIQPDSPLFSTYGIMGELFLRQKRLHALEVKHRHISLYCTCLSYL